MIFARGALLKNRVLALKCSCAAEQNTRVPLCYRAVLPLCSRYRCNSGFEEVADSPARDNVNEMSSLAPVRREGWAEDAKRLADENDDALVWPEIPNDGDEDLAW